MVAISGKKLQLPVEQALSKSERPTALGSASNDAPAAESLDAVQAAYAKRQNMRRGMPCNFMKQSWGLIGSHWSSVEVTGTTSNSLGLIGTHRNSLAPHELTTSHWN